MSLEAGRAAEPPESLPEPSLGAGLRGGPAAPRGLGGGWMLPGGEEEGKERLHALLAADLGRTPPGSCPLGATAARGTLTRCWSSLGMARDLWGREQRDPRGWRGEKGGKEETTPGDTCGNRGVPEPPVPLWHPGQDAAHGVSWWQGHGVPVGLRGDTRARGRRLHHGATQQRQGWR